MNTKQRMKKVTLPNIEGYRVCDNGCIVKNGERINDIYVSTLNRNFIRLIDKNGNTTLYPIDELVANAFVPKPKTLSRLRVIHIDNVNGNDDFTNLQWIVDKEIWKDVNIHGIVKNRYRISNWGNFTNNGNRVKFGGVNSRGYVTLKLMSTNGSIVSTTLHKLVAMYFVPNPNVKEYKEINHIDGCKIHNCWTNLEWCSHKKNMEHMVFTDLRDAAKGSKSYRATINEETVEVVCKELIRFWGRAFSVYKFMINRGYDITLKQIQHIKNKGGWQHISDKFWSKADLIELERKKIHMICQCLLKLDGDTVSTYTELKPIIPDITVRYIQIIKYKEDNVDISDQYFKKGQFKK